MPRFAFGRTPDDEISPIIRAISGADFEAVRKLLAVGVDPNADDPTFSTSPRAFAQMTLTGLKQSLQNPAAQAMPPELHAMFDEYTREAPRLEAILELLAKPQGGQPR